MRCLQGVLWEGVKHSVESAVLYVCVHTDIEIGKSRYRVTAFS